MARKPLPYLFALAVAASLFAKDFFIVHTKDGSHVRYNLSDVDSVTCGSEKEEGLVAYYPFNGDASDASGYGNHGRSQRATMTEDRHGNPNTAYLFDGDRSYIVVSDDPSLDFGKGADFAVVLWARTDALAGTLLAKYRSEFPRGGYTVAMADDKTGKVWLDGRDRDGYRFTGASKTGISDGRWHMLAGMRQGTIWSIWVDGHLEKSIDAGSNEAVDNDMPLIIGCNFDVNVRGAYFKGAIDDIRIFKRALSAEEIQALYEE